MPWTRFLGGFDIHGDKQDAAANKVFFKFAEIWKPQIRICGGDLFDLRPLRRGASADEMMESLEKDWEAGTAWLERFKPQFFLHGNHDWRLYNLAERGHGIAGDWAQSKVGKLEDLAKRLRCRMLPYHNRDGILRLGDTNVYHGFFSGVNAVRQSANTYRKSFFGHTHTIDVARVPGLDRAVAQGVGSLCLKDLQYNNRHPASLRQANGFPYGLVNEKTGDTRIFQAEEIGGKWVLPTDTVEL